MNKIRVLHIVQNLAIGGLERTAVQLAAYSDRSSFETELWCLSGGGPLEAILAREKVPFRIFAYTRYLLPGSIRSLSREIKKARFDVVHTHAYAPGVLGRFAARRAGVPVVIHHQHTDVAYQMTAFQKMVERFLSRHLTDRVIACSESSRAMLIKEGFGTQGNISVTHNGIPQAFADPSGAAESLRCELGLEGKKIVVTVASLTPHKGHRNLLEAVPAVVAKCPDTVFIFVGSGPERENLAAQAAQTGLDGRILFAGTRDDVRPYLEIADIFVLPSLRENMPLSVLEAMAKKLPVVASRVGGIPEIVRDGETGILVPPGQPEAMATAINDLLASAEKRVTFGSKGLERFQELFTLSRMISSVQHRYTSALAERRSSEDLIRLIFDKETLPPAKRAVAQAIRLLLACGLSHTAAGRWYFRLYLLRDKMLALIGIPKNERSAEYTWVMRNLPRNRDSRILEIGCSGGLFAFELVSRFHSVTGVDTREYTGSPERLAFSCADAARLPFPDGSFDQVVIISTLEHIGLGAFNDPRYDNGDRTVVREIARVLAKGGMLLLTVPYGDPPAITWQRYYNRTRLMEITGECFDAVNEEYYRLSGARWRKTPREKMSPVPTDVTSAVACLALRRR